MSSKTLIAAAAMPVVLSILEGRESYGYQIIQRVRRASGGKLDWSTSLLYPVLHRMERDKLIKSRWELSEKGRMQRVYQITEAGRKALAAEKKRWLDLHAALREIWRKGDVLD